MKQNTLVQILFSIYIFVFIIFSTSGLGLVGWKLMFNQYQTYALLLVPICLILINLRSVILIKNYWKLIVIYLCIMPIISTITKTILIDESFGSVMSPILISLAFCFFFPFCVYKIRPNTIIIPLFIIALLTLVIQVYQQITGIIIFDAWADLYELSERNNLLRFWVGTPYIQMFCLFFCWYKFLTKRNILFLGLFAVFLASVYLYLTRQLIIASILTIAASLFISTNKKVKKVILFTSIALIVLLLLYWDVLVNGFIEEAKGDSYSTDIRMEAIPFFIEQSFDNIIGFIFGHGHSHYEEKWTSKGYYASDVGFIGDMYHFGITWVLVYFYTTYLVLTKLRKKIPLYLTMYVIAALIYSLFGFPYHSFDTAFIWICVIYISSIYQNIYDKRLKRKKLISKVKKRHHIVDSLSRHNIEIVNNENINLPILSKE